jgi:3' terminal RNA ribose 2'-O-methyltransferase Hen1
MITPVILTISTTNPPATDLGYLLHKHPDRYQVFDLAWGKAHVFYPEATAARCTAALLLDIDPVALVRGRESSPGLLAQYVNDRPYVASSFLSVAINQVFRTALSGRCEARPELAEIALPLRATLAALPCRGGEAVLRRLFEPLGYEVTTHTGPLDAAFPEWGDGEYLAVTLTGEQRLCDLLAHLYVLIPVLDDRKHYWVAEAEIEKLLARGAAWLSAHPEREFISRRYLRHRRYLVDEAMQRLAEAEGAPEGEEDEAREDAPSLNAQRLAAVVAALKARRVHRVLDLGCGEGALLGQLLEDPSFTEIVGMDVSWRALEMAKRRLRWEQMPPARQARLTLRQGSLLYRDASLAGYDGAAVVEVIEHLDPPRLEAFARVLLGCAQPRVVVLTTPNAEYNARYGSLPAGDVRHRDHRFEWGREQFADWATRVAGQYGYRVAFESVGEDDPAVGAPTQMAIFEREAVSP